MQNDTNIVNSFSLVLIGYQKVDSLTAENWIVESLHEL